jgi:acylglycerol lipase
MAQTEGMKANGVLFHTVRYSAPGHSKGNVVFLHGFADHVARYSHWFERFSQAGYSIFAYDMRFAGQTAKDAGTQGVAAFPDLLSDLDFFVQQEWRRSPGEKLYLMGHSTGGLLAAMCLLRLRAGPTLILEQTAHAQIPIPACRSYQA